MYVVGIIRRFCGDFLERITHLVKAPVLSLVLCFWVWKKKNVKKDKDRPRCSCGQCEPKGDRSMRVQGANPQSSKLEGAQCEPNMSLLIEIAYWWLWLDRNSKYQSLGKISQRHRTLGHNFNTWKTECMLSFNVKHGNVKHGTSHPEPIR
jgi:hypothetical protein